MPHLALIFCLPARKTCKLILATLLVVLLSVPGFEALAQGGLAVTPTKLYFDLAPGESRSAKIVVTNQSSKRQLFEVSFSDWERDSLGNKVYLPDNTSENSCSQWMVVTPSLFELNPNEPRELTVVMTRPKDSIGGDGNEKIKWSMLFIKQTAEKASIEESSKVLESRMIIEFRVGVHVYYTPIGQHAKNVEIVSFKTEMTDKGKKKLALKLENTGDVVTDSEVALELVNVKTGEERKVKAVPVSIFPGNKRVVYLTLPDELLPGLYSAVAIVDNGPDYELKMAELELKLE